LHVVIADLRKDAPALRRLRTACERAKRQLSSAASTDINIDSLTAGRDFNYVVTRRTLESLCQDIFVSIRETLSQTLKAANLSSSSSSSSMVDEIDEVLLVGGSAKMPRVIDEVKRFFGKAPVDLGERACELVAIGASLLSDSGEAESPLSQADVLTLEVLDATIG
jgi:molecular chaperone DnaK (HSP70)